MLDIYTLGDDILRQKCEEVKTFDHALELLEQAMYATLEKADGVGLAGPQVGDARRIFVVDIPKEGVRKTFVNPQIIETSVETGPYNEGCLSIPGLDHDVVRPLRVTVCAQDVKGRPFTVNASGLFARVIQHEYDHLEGRLYIDRLDETERRHMISKYEKMKKARLKAGKRRR